MAVNAGGSVAALGLTRTFGWSFGQEGHAAEVVRVLVAGLGAIGLFRTKLFIGKESASQFNWSPGVLLDKLLSITDREVQRGQASWRSKQVSRIMKGVDFEKAWTALPAYVLVLLDAKEGDLEKDLLRDVRSLHKDRSMDLETKSQILGVRLVRVAGINLLRSAVHGLGSSIR